MTNNVQLDIFSDSLDNETFPDEPTDFENNDDLNFKEEKLEPASFSNEEFLKDEELHRQFKKGFNEDLLLKLNKSLASELNYPHGYPVVTYFDNEKDNVIELYINYVASTAVRLLEEDALGYKPSKEDMAVSAFPDILAEGSHNYISHVMYSLDPNKELGASSQLVGRLMISDSNVPFMELHDDKAGILGNEKYENMVNKVLEFVSGFKFPISDNQVENEKLLDAEISKMADEIREYKENKKEVSLVGQRRGYGE